MFWSTLASLSYFYMVSICSAHSTYSTYSTHSTYSTYSEHGTHSTYDTYSTYSTHSASYYNHRVCLFVCLFVYQHLTFAHDRCRNRLMSLAASLECRIGIDVPVQPFVQELEQNRSTSCWKCAGVFLLQKLIRMCPLEKVA